MMKRHKSFLDQITQMFPPTDGKREMGVNSCHAKTVTIQVTEACNLCCTYCYQCAKTSKRMSFDTAKKIIDMLLASDSRTNQYITTNKIPAIIFDFIGGEPFLEVDLIDRIMDYFVEQTFIQEHPLAGRFMISISSNGTLYFQPEVQRFIKKWHQHLSLGISIDGNKQLHDSCRIFPDGSGSYDMAMAAAEDYMRRYGYLGSKMTIAPGNVEFVREAVNDLIAHGYREIYLNCVFEEGWNIDHAKSLYWQLKGLADDILSMDDIPMLSIFSETIGHKMEPCENRNWCGGTGCMLAWDCDGKAYPCIRYTPSSLGGEQEPYTIGDLEHGLMNTPEHAKRVALLDSITRESQSTAECFNCPIASGCAWCSGYNYQKFGTPNQRATYICIMHKARVLANAYFWNKLYQMQGVDRHYALNIPDDWAIPIVGENELMELKMLANGGGDFCGPD